MQQKSIAQKLLILCTGQLLALILTESFMCTNHIYDHCSLKVRIFKMQKLNICVQIFWTVLYVKVVLYSVINSISKIFTHVSLFMFP